MDILIISKSIDNLIETAIANNSARQGDPCDRTPKFSHNRPSTARTSFSSGRGRGKESQFAAATTTGQFFKLSDDDMMTSFEQSRKTKGMLFDGGKLRR